MLSDVSRRDPGWVTLWVGLFAIVAVSKEPGICTR